MNIIWYDFDVEPVSKFSVNLNGQSILDKPDLFLRILMLTIVVLLLYCNGWLSSTWMAILVQLLTIIVPGEDLPGMRPSFQCDFPFQKFLLMVIHFAFLNNLRATNTRIIMIMLFWILHGWVYKRRITDEWRFDLPEDSRNLCECFQFKICVGSLPFFFQY